jgi:WD40 repeat protein
MSVAFSPDGATIVSGSRDKTVKVWDAVKFRPHVESEWKQFDKAVESEYSDEEDEVEEWWRNKVTGHEQAAKPSGGSPLGH